MKTAIQIKNLKFNYKQHTQLILDIPSWQVKQGEHLFIQGPSGCGKSTLLNIISGLLPVKTGHIDIFDTHLHTLSGRQRDRFRSQKMGYVFQRFNLIPYLNAIDNVRLACAFTDNKIDNSELDEQVQSLLVSLGIDKLHWHKPSNQLSVGQQQRVAIARAMIHKPQLLIIDEPTSSLDHHSRDIFMSLLLQQIESTDLTLIFVSHDQSLSSFFSRSQSINDINYA